MYMYKKAKICNPHIIILGKEVIQGMRKLIIDENTVYELDENCMLTQKVSDNKEEKKINREKEAEKTKNK